MEMPLNLGTAPARIQHLQTAESVALPSPESHSETWTTLIVSSPPEILKLEPFVRSVAPDRGMLSPSFFLASVRPQDWRPRVVVVTKGRRLAGVFYAKERFVSGMGTRLAFVDDSLEAMVAASPAEADEVTSCAVRALTNRMLGVRLLVARDRVPFLSGIQHAAELRFRPGKRHTHLALPESFDEFLAILGPRSRRNFRYYRRKSEQAGNQFSCWADCSEFSAASRQLLPRAAFGGAQEDLERCLAMIKTMPSRIMVGLRRSSGEWISLAGGWQEGTRAVIILQLNDRGLTRESLSVVLRSYLVEELINRGVRELVFWAGSSAPLSEYAYSPDQCMVSIDSRSLAWRLVQKATAVLTKLAPSASGEWKEWLIAAGERSHS
jgi:hypothetical protein